MSENLKAMLQSRIKDLSKQIENFDASQYATYGEYDTWLNDNYRPVTVGGFAFAPAEVLRKCLHSTQYHQEFKRWADKLDKTQLNAYAQLQDDLEQNLSWLEELK